MRSSFFYVYNLLFFTPILTDSLSLPVFLTAALLISREREFNITSVATATEGDSPITSPLYNFQAKNVS